MKRRVIGLVACIGVALVSVRAQQPPAPEAARASLDYEFFKTQVQPLFLAKREGLVRCVQCHGRPNGTAFRLEPLPPGATTWDEEHSRKNFAAVRQLVSPGDPMASRLLMHPLSRTA